MVAAARRQPQPARARAEALGQSPAQPGCPDRARDPQLAEVGAVVGDAEDVVVVVVALEEGRPDARRLAQVVRHGRALRRQRRRGRGVPGRPFGGQGAVGDQLGPRDAVGARGRLAGQHVLGRAPGARRQRQHAPGRERRPRRERLWGIDGAPEAGWYYRGRSLGTSMKGRLNIFRVGVVLVALGAAACDGSSDRRLGRDPRLVEAGRRGRGDRQAAGRLQAAEPGREDRRLQRGRERARARCHPEQDHGRQSARYLPGQRRLGPDGVGAGQRPRRRSVVHAGAGSGDAGLDRQGARIRPHQRQLQGQGLRRPAEHPPLEHVLLQQGGVRRTSA